MISSREAREAGTPHKYGNEERPLTVSTIVVPYKTATGMAKKEFTVYRTQHGPIVREANGKWVAIKIMQEPLKALTQSYSRTKAKSYKAFRETMDLHTNSSNNTIYADGDGDIAYFHANFIPKRDPKFDWTKPVDGSDPATEWKGLLTVEESPHLLNPASGWLFNVNNAPWTASGPSSPKKADYPAYVETGGESARGLHAIRVLQNKKDFTLNSLMSAAYDSYLLRRSKKMIPPLIKAWDAAPAVEPAQGEARGADRQALRGWDYRWGRDVDTYLSGGILGTGSFASRWRGCAQSRRRCGRLRCKRCDARPTAASTLGGVRQAHRRFRHVEDAVGRHQSVPAAHR